LYSPLVPIQATGKKVPLFCIHPAGGNVLSFFELSKELGTDQPFYALQAIGLEKDIEPDVSVETMAARYLEAILPVQSSGSYLLAGWSFGGLVAFEMAQQLSAQGKSVAFLGLIDTAIPALMTSAEKDDAQLLVDLFKEDLTLSLENLRHLQPDDQLRYVINEAHQAHLFPPSWGWDQASRLMKVFKTNLKATENYIPQSYQGSIHLFQAEDSELATDDPSMGWSPLALKGVEVCLVPGNHKTLLRPPHVHVLAAKIKDHLEQVITTQGDG
jgi:thioesterase domain-containing protein